jgi:putative transposase
LFRRINISPNAYYNYLKDKKRGQRLKKQKIKEKITELYHTYEGRPGHRMICALLKGTKFSISKATVHKYMNKELKKYSIVFRKRPGYVKGKAHKVFPNLLKRNFEAKKRHTVLCTDFTYTRLKNGIMVYNCTILDLFNREVLASETGAEITTELAIKTIRKALKFRRGSSLILHSDQGSQFTSKMFVEFCKERKITQSMSKAGCPYDNAVMERYFNTLKNEMIYHHVFESVDMADKKIKDFAFYWYNRKRPHTYNGGKPPAKVKKLA